MSGATISTLFSRIVEFLDHYPLSTQRWELFLLFQIGCYFTGTSLKLHLYMYISFPVLLLKWKLVN